MSDLSRLQEFGQSIWLDYIRRSYLLDGGFARHVALGVRGVTSNPTIFEQAISAGADYDAQIGPLVAAGVVGAEAFEELALRDIRMAANILRSVYAATDGADGYVSMEVSPDLAHDAAGTIDQATHLWQRLSAPNIMIKVPGTPEGVQAIEELIYRGINVNVTLLFSLSQHRAIAAAYIRGLERRVQESLPVKGIHSVASFFVSRVDTLVDRRLADLGQGSKELLGKAAVANAKLAYRLFEELFLGERFAALRQQGANLQRPLWASTSTKNPDYRDVVYIEELIGRHTVNTVPMKTLDAFIDHGVAAETVTRNVAEAKAHVSRLKELSIDLDEVGEVLQAEGVASFAKSYETLLSELAQKSGRLLPEPAVRLSLGDLGPAASRLIEDLSEEGAPNRLLQRDVTLFPEGEHRKVAAERMGWLALPDSMRQKQTELAEFTSRLGSLGIREVVLAGMGGSSLFPDLLSRVAANANVRLTVLDTTHPDTVRMLLSRIDWTTTLAIMSSKSGTTREVDTLYRILRQHADASLGREQAGAHFAAITDPHTPLGQRAREEGFAHLFENPADIGGRYSALSLFGLVPAAVLGYDIEGLLLGAASVLKSLEGPVYMAGPAVLAAALRASDLAGRQKLVLPSGRSLPFADWLEQLIAESTGKQEQGMLPAPGAAPGPDRLSAGFGSDPARPFVAQPAPDTAQRLGQAVMLWEAATALYGHLAGLDPFDQPNVSESKENTEAMLRGGEIPQPEGSIEDVRRLSRDLRAPSYLAVQAYAPPSEELWAALSELQEVLSRVTGCTVTVGVGPRFLHSTGQYHKGGRPYGAFLQLVAPYGEDLPVPDEPFSLGTLFMAQSAGDRQAILRRNRPLAALMLPSGDAAAAIRKIARELAS